MCAPFLCSVLLPGPNHNFSEGTSQIGKSYSSPLKTTTVMARVLVTGASGFLASHIVSQLLKSGEYIVRGTVRSLSNEKKVAPLRKLKSANAKYDLELVEADLTKKESWTE